MGITIGDLVLRLADDPDPSWRDELLAAKTAELERLRAENTAALASIASSDIRLDIGALIQEVMQAVTAITTDDVVRYARQALNDSETRATGEIVLAFGAIWLWGERPKPSNVASETLNESEPENELRLAIANAALLRWFASLSLPMQASLLQLLAASPAELEALGIWTPPGASGTHLNFIIAFVIATSALVAIRRE